MNISRFLAHPAVVGALGAAAGAARGLSEDADRRRQEQRNATMKSLETADQRAYEQQKYQTVKGDAQDAANQQRIDKWLEDLRDMAVRDPYGALSMAKSPPGDMTPQQQAMFQQAVATAQAQQPHFDKGTGSFTQRLTPEQIWDQTQATKREEQAKLRSQAVQAAYDGDEKRAKELTDQVGDAGTTQAVNQVLINRKKDNKAQAQQDAFDYAIDLAGKIPGDPYSWSPDTRIAYVTLVGQRGVKTAQLKQMFPGLVMSEQEMSKYAKEAAGRPKSALGSVEALRTLAETGELPKDYRPYDPKAKLQRPNAMSPDSFRASYDAAAANARRLNLGRQPDGTEPSTPSDQVDYSLGRDAQKVMEQNGTDDEKQQLLEELRTLGVPQFRIDQVAGLDLNGVRNAVKLARQTVGQ